MPKLPRISSRECVRALQRAGFTIIRQRGSHLTMARTEPFVTVTVPENKELPLGTLKSILRSADLTVDEFIELL